MQGRWVTIPDGDPLLLRGRFPSRNEAVTVRGTMEGRAAGDVTVPAGADVACFFQQLQIFLSAHNPCFAGMQPLVMLYTSSPFR
jgi:hypothetical protein